MAIFACSVAAAGAFSGPLATAIGFMSGIAGLSGYVPLIHLFVDQGAKKLTLPIAGNGYSSSKASLRSSLG